MRFVETPIFTHAAEELLEHESYRQLQYALVLRPREGVVIPKSGGLRKMRWSLASAGKRGGCRIIYFWDVERDILYALCVPQERRRRHYAATTSSFDAARTRGVRMKKQDFDRLSASIRQAGAIRRGEIKPTRVTEFRADDVKEIRHQLGKSQSEFASMIGVSVATLQNWEQGRRRPEGPARALLMVAARSPKVVAEALDPKRTP